MDSNSGHKIRPQKSRESLENRLILQKRKQPGVTFPSARKQEYLLIVRLNLEPSALRDRERVRAGLRDLCRLFEAIHNGLEKVEVLLDDGTLDRVPISTFNFSPTLGFGIGFFEKLNIRREKVPKRLYEMPNHIGLLDPIRYKLLQTDLIVQLGSSKEFVNRWVLENDIYPLANETQNGYQNYKPANIFDIQHHNHYSSNASRIHDIVSAIRDWAIVVDVHAGFQRLDGRNLMGFNDGVSNVDRLDNNVVWTNRQDEEEMLTDGTYMVFNKIEHDLDRWRTLDDREKERWVGRSKGTGLLLGTLSENEDKRLAKELRSDKPLVRRTALTKLRKLLDDQNDPEESVFDSTQSKFQNIKVECPVWSHVRKANPRGEGGIQGIKIFRRGYLFMESSPEGKISSGLLFICFQRDIEKGYEYIKKRLLNNKNFPVPESRRRFNNIEVSQRHRHGRFSEEELKSFGPYEKSLLGLVSKVSYDEAIAEARNKDSQNTGREGLCGPSKLGVNPNGEFLATVTLGGGYYFVPPIPGKEITRIGDQFFE